MSDMLVSSQAYFGQLVIVCSFLGGMVFGGLLCFRQTRRTGILGFAATCAVVALIVAGTEIAEGGRTIGHVLAAAAVIGFLFPIVGAAPACAIIGIARLLRAITRRTVKAMRTFSSNVVTDVLRIAKRRSDQECGPRRLSKASRLSTTFLVLTGTMFIGLNMGAISALATRFAPRLSIVTNCLDLISLILVTPKLFTIEERDNVRDLSIQTLRPFTITKITIPRNILTPVLRATMFVLLLFISKYLLDYNASKILVICGTLQDICQYPFPRDICQSIL